MNPSFDDSVSLDRLLKLASGVREQLARVVVGQTEAIDLIMIGLLANGHCLLIGVPGLAKTLIVRTFANVLDASFARIQFTPDLMPSDVTGTDVLVQNVDTGDRSFRFLRGPIFANVLLADEINRAPPKTQSALLEAMQERQVTIGAERHWLPDPFFVLATQNPIEHEGTYPLPEAQLDRFMFVVNLDYPGESDELRMLMQTTSDDRPEVQALMHTADILDFRHLIRRIAISESLAAIALRLVRLTRPTADNPIKEIRDCVAFGAGPRAGQFLILAAKCSAALRGSPLVLEEDVFRFVQPIMLHRIKTNFSGQAKGLRERDLIDIVVQFVQDELKNKAQRSGAGKLLRS
jgi:MoxR-like ATPase